ncbi:hypothetical protein L227DRAFT_417081 [Lentinus tigrinus ALCF2SS1-6]|uniref:Uncharacterized protein n=1 Tax=Lentinus tigrinus ALCF2SS1-6 TaxID=1328759 RepID=A0A5C2SIS4_9APHY|nr:hypothetical protein L227DRAFT_417081 [Lentinus tigrinus ALCF2SS1-6]
MAEVVPETVPDDDNDPDWVDEDVYRPQYLESSLSDREVWRKNEGREFFIDITRVGFHRQTEVFRIRSRNLSPAFLRSYRDLWQLPPRVRKKMSASKYSGLGLMTTIFQTDILVRRTSSYAESECGL